MQKADKLKIEAVRCYKCPMCKTIHKIAPLAHSCFKRCLDRKREQEIAEVKAQKREVIRNSVRLEATSLTAAINLLVEKAKEHYNLDLKIDTYPARFGLQSITHSCPLGKETNWGAKSELPRGHLGWHGQWKGTIKGKYKSFFSSSRGPSFSDFLKEAFYGFHTGTGSGGAEFDIGGEIFLEDFPKIYKSEIKKYEGNRLCCRVHPLLECAFCRMLWCDPCRTLVKNLQEQCPLDGHKLYLK